MSTINLYYWRGQHNFGDYLSPYIVARLSGKQVQYDLLGSRLLASGSMLNDARTGDKIWGAGLRTAEMRTKLKINIFAVRGPLTRQILLGSGYDCPEIYGHPALLLPRFFTRPVTIRTGVAVMPHMTDRWLVGGDRIIRTDGDVVETINSILSCEVLVTSSLTGLAIAHAFEVPAILLRNSYHLKLEPPFKYCDYFQGTQQETYCKVDISVNEAIKFAKVGTPVIDDNFVKAFWEATNVHLSFAGQKTIAKSSCNSPKCGCRTSSPTKILETEVYP